MANLVFKYSWDHRPFPYNSAQGKRQFMLPFASGIPNLTPDYTQVAGLGTAATKNTGTGDGEIPVYTAAGLSGFGYGGRLRIEPIADVTAQVKNGTSKVEFVSPSAGWDGTVGAQFGPMIRLPRTTTVSTDLILPYYAGLRATAMVVRSFSFLNGVYSGTEQTVYTSGNPIVANTLNSDSSGKLVTVETTGELRSKGFTVDANGFYKSASPIVQLFSDRIKLNEEASEQDITFEKVDDGIYLIKGSSGFATEGWYIEQPRDANGNLFHVVEYKTLENGDIEIKTFDYMLDKKGRIVADYTSPLDIQEGRWIDIRLQEVPKPEVDEGEDTIPPDLIPPEFQPTNLSQAVAAAMNGVEPPEISDTDETL